LKIIKENKEIEQKESEITEWIEEDKGKMGNMLRL